MYDIVIIGGGVAGLSAAIYSVRFGLHPIIIAKVPGGLITNTHLVENWPGFSQISGFELGMKIKEHAESLGVEIKEENVEKIEKEKNNFKVKTDNDSYTCQSLLIATGTKHRTLDIPGEKELLNKGISYCATCDAAFFRNKTVGMAGGGDSAVKEALLLAEFASRVYIIYRGDKLRAEPINIQRLSKQPKIEVIYKTNIVSALGKDKLEGVTFDNGKILKLDGLFVEIGQLPQSELVNTLGAKLNEKNEIIIDQRSRTNIPRLYAAGDVTNDPYKQAIIGSAQGVIAAFSAYEDLKKMQ